MVLGGKVIAMLKTQASLETIAKGKGVLSESKLKQLRRWIDDDWESCDIDRDAVKVIDRLLVTIDVDRATIESSRTYQAHAKAKGLRRDKSYT